METKDFLHKFRHDLYNIVNYDIDDLCSVNYPFSPHNYLEDFVRDSLEDLYITDLEKNKLIFINNILIERIESCIFELRSILELYIKNRSFLYKYYISNKEKVLKLLPKDVDLEFSSTFEILCTIFQEHQLYETIKLQLPEISIENLLQFYYVEYVYYTIDVLEHIATTITNTIEKYDLEYIKKTKLELNENFNFDFHSVEQPINNLFSERNLLLHDYSDTSTHEKLIILDKLGVLDYLDEKLEKPGTKKHLTEILSAIMGVNAKTLNTYVTPLRNKDIYNPLNPYHAEKNSPNADKILRSFKLKNTD